MTGRVLVFDAARSRQRLGVEGAPAGSVVLLGDGQVIRLDDCGIADVVVPPGHPHSGLASDLSARAPSTVA